MSLLRLLVELVHAEGRRSPALKRAAFVFGFFFPANAVTMNAALPDLMRTDRLRDAGILIILNVYKMSN